MESSINNDSDNSICRLTDLPEHLLLHILSFLPTIDAVKTSSISRRWRNLWSSIPSLYFSYDLFPPSDSPSTTCRRFADSVGHTLLHRLPNSPLLTFCLEFVFTEFEYSSLIASWIFYAINHQVINLELDFYIDRTLHTDHSGLYFDFPFYALRNSCVRVLKLTRCYLSMPTYMASGEFASLHTMFLDNIELTDQIVSDLMTGCPNLESLSLETCYGMENVKIQGLKIKKLSLRFFYGDSDSGSVEIVCPNLHFLDIVGYEVGEYLLKESSVLVEASVYFLHKLQMYGCWSKVVSLLGHVRKLTVQNWWFKLLVSKDVFSESFKFDHLRWLELQTGYTHYELLGIAALLELSPNLSTLVLDFLYKIDEDESVTEDVLNRPINLNLPRLRQVKLMAFEGTENEVRLLKLLIEQGIVLQKLVVVPCMGGIFQSPLVFWLRT